MNANVTKMNTGKLLAVIAIMAMVIAGAAVAFSDNEASAVQVEPENGMPLSNSILAVYEELSIEGEAYIPTGENVVLTIPADKTLRIMSGGVLYLNNGTLNVLGSLIIENGASVIGDGKIVLTRTGTFENAGILGATYVSEGVSTQTSVTISADVSGIADSRYEGVGEVTVSTVSGMTFGFVNTTNDVDGAQYTLTVGGTLIAEEAPNNAATNNKITINGARIVGEMYIGQDVTVDVTASDIRSGSSITVDGTLNVNDKALVMYNGSSIEVNGSLEGTVSAVAGDYAANLGESTCATTSTFAITYAEGATYSASGYALSVASSNYQADDADRTLMTAQRLYIEGTVNYVADYNSTATSFSGTMTFTGVGAVVAAETTLSLPGTMQISNTGAPIQTLGTIQINSPTTAYMTNVEYAGAYYGIQTTGANATNTIYITSFDAAMQAIDTANPQTVTVMGETDIDGEYTLDAGQRLIFSEGDITVTENGSLTISQRSSVSGTEITVNGVMTVQTPSTCNVDIISATVSTGVQDNIRYTQYAGLQYAIDNATAGDEISVTGTANIDGNLVIPQGVTVTVEDNGKVNITGNLTVESEATLNVVDSTAAVTMTGLKSAVTVDGTMDVSMGILNFTPSETGTERTSLTSAGTFIAADSSIADAPTTINGVAYLNADGNTVVTNAEAAITATSAMDVTTGIAVLGSVTAGDLNLTVDMTVTDGADANFGTITLADGCTISGPGEISATVSATTGAEGSTATSSVVLDNVKNLTVSADNYSDAQNIRTYQLLIDGNDFTGTVTVSAGTVTVDDSLTVESTVDGENTYYAILNIDGTLVVPEGATLTANTARNGAAAVTVDGELVADGIVDITAMDVNGTFTVNYGSDVEIVSGGSMTVTGELVMSAEDNEVAEIVVNGTLAVGEKITTMGGSTTGTVTGAIDTNNAGKVKVYNGASVEAAVIDDDGNGATGADSTVFYINGNVYMTVYGQYTVSDILGNEDIEIVGYDMTAAGYDISDIDSWYADAELTKAAQDDSEAVYTMVDASDVRVTISVGTAISLYVDNIKYTSGQTAVLSVGTHTVTTQVNPGYSGTVTVQFNGQTINGSFTITPEMASAAYSGDITLTATGDITYDAGSVTVDNSDDGMGITDYLLIILVILVIVLAIFVALRMMRS